jgi:hypothetical protein
MKTMDRRLMWGLGAAGLTAVTLLLLGYMLGTAREIAGGVLGAPLDDAWIHFQFARNLSQGMGFSFNAGEPTPGSTAPLWTVLLAPIGFFSEDFMAPALGLSAFFLLLGVWAAYGFAGWTAGRLWPGLLAGLGTAMAGRFLWAGLAGMETTAFAALSVIAIWAYSKKGLTWWAALLFGLAAQLRPEGHALFALALLDSVWVWAQAQRKAEQWRWRTAVSTFLPPLLVYGLTALPYALFSLSTTGRPLPNTFYAKAGSEHFFSWRALRETVTYQWQDNAASFLFMIVGLWPMWRRNRLAVLWLVGLPLMTAVVIDFTWHHGRYTMPLIPLQMVVGAVGVDWLVRRLLKDGQETAARWLLPLALGVMFLLPGLWRVPDWAVMLGNNTREIEEIDVALGRWLADNTEPEALIAVDDIGAIAFLSGRRIVDMHGLVSPEVWPVLAQPEGLARSQELTRILSASAPDYMAAFPLWHWDLATNTAVATPIHHVRTETQTIIFQQDAAVYETTWPYIAVAEPEFVRTAVFGEAIRLLGYDLPPGEGPALTLYWESLAVVTESYDLFVHLVDSNGQIVAQLDQKPVGGLAATDVWRVGDIVRDPLVLALPQTVPAGEYALRVGVYERDSGRRLAVQDGEVVDDALVLGMVALPQARAGGTELAMPALSRHN